MNGPDPDTLVVLGSTLQFNPVDLRNGTSNARATGNRKFAIDDVVGQEQSQLHNIRVVIAFKCPINARAAAHIFRRDRAQHSKYPLI